LFINRTQVEERKRTYSDETSVAVNSLLLIDVYNVMKKMLTRLTYHYHFTRIIIIIIIITLLLLLLLMMMMMMMMMTVNPDLVR